MTWNFSAGPAMLPREVLVQAQTELLNWKNMGASVMEISHRSPEFEVLAQEMKQDLRELLKLPESFEILLTTGGARAQFAYVPMNFLLPEEQADYLITGGWSLRAAQEAKRFAKVNLVADNTATQHTQIPPHALWQEAASSQYFHYVSNETVHGVQFHHLPEAQKPLIADMSSD